MGPLIAPCRCKGSMKYVHAEPCLRLWLASRRGGEPAAQCEICHHRCARSHDTLWESSLSNVRAHDRKAVAPIAAVTFAFFRCRYAIEYKAELSCKWESVCSAHSWGSYCECLGVGMMICCLVTTLAVLYHHRKDPMAFDSYTNYAVMIAMGLVLVVASFCTLKKITSRWWRANSVTSLRPMVVSLADDDDDDDDDDADGGPGPHNC
jgi:hypothetical protein